MVLSPESELSEPLEPGLYIVATPIGNLGDITMRAVDILRKCDLIACEDTRVTGRLLKALGIENRMQRYDDYASNETRAWILGEANKGAIALVSDAGTPLISDPGHRLVREANETGINVVAIPGPCAAIAGLTLSGLPNDRFLFAGFLPVKDKARRDFLDGLAAIDATLILYETGPRLTRSLEVLAEIWPDRSVAVAREITKLHEECRTGSAVQLLDHYANHPAKGEIVLMIGPPVAAAMTVDPDELLRDALQHQSPSKAAGEVARQTGMDRKALYNRAIEIKGQ